MTKSPRFESKTSEDMYRSLDEVEEVEARRRVRMMDPGGPFRRSSGTTGRSLRRISSNISMKDVSGSTHMVNTNQLPKAPTLDCREASIYQGVQCVL